MTTLVRVETSYFVCGLVVTDAVVSEAASIMKWAIGKPFATVADWIAEKGGTWSASLGGGEDAKPESKQEVLSRSSKREETI